METREMARYGRVHDKAVVVDGANIGSISLVDSDNNRVQVMFVNLNDGFTRKGHGTQLYKKIGYELAKEGKILISSECRLEPAEGLWKSLTRDGYARFISNENPDDSYYEFIPK